MNAFDPFAAMSHPASEAVLRTDADLHAADGRRLAASYANFLIVNGAVLMPGYGDPAAAAAARVLARAFPDRAIEIVPCRPLIEQNGSLHCVTMQLPRGVLAND